MKWHVRKNTADGIISIKDVKEKGNKGLIYEKDNLIYSFIINI